jgi:hypothetical protein
MGKLIYFIIVVILASLIFAFYWYGYRPSTIKKSCAEAVRRGSEVDLAKEFGWGDFYSNCLHKKGL